MIPTLFCAESALPGLRVAKPLDLRDYKLPGRSIYPKIPRGADRFV